MYMKASIRGSPHRGPFELSSIRLLLETWSKIKDCYLGRSLERQPICLPWGLSFDQVDHHIILSHYRDSITDLLLIMCLKKQPLWKYIEDITPLYQHHLLIYMGFPGGSVAKNLPAMQETQVQSLGREDPLEKGMATHFSMLAWRIPSTQEIGKLQSMGSQRIRNDWATNTYKTPWKRYLLELPATIIFISTVGTRRLPLYQQCRIDRGFQEV